MKTCKCGQQIASNARFCPHCGHRFTHPFTMFIAICFAAIFGFAFIGAIIGGIVGGSPNVQSAGQGHTDSIGRAVPASVTNDAEVLLHRCGKPDKDDSTAYDNPRPPIPTRMITYKEGSTDVCLLSGC
ncbi:MAG: zinc-ribbon domain-containing protein [Terriglobales bacterium]